MGGHRGTDGGNRKGHAAALEPDLEFIESAIDALAGSLLVAAQGGSDLVEFTLLEKSQNDGGAIFRSELIDGLVEDGRK
ncbi:MAG TPA: hypothetical protein VNM37_05845, partial [Candidatus Dormibacteraeota bacterium]|nr:hypothetical protein [Candidatus Dormibacteraeota bacterium]